MGEFELIDRFWAGQPPAPGVKLGVGDDCALLTVKKGRELAATTDTLVEGRHFFPGTDPYYLGWRALAVNLSDLAAMGAKPHSFLSSLTLPAADDKWLKAFAGGLLTLARKEGIALIGGNMSKGPLSITITALGTVKPGRAMLRSGAQVGDGIYVSGFLGAPGLYVLSGEGKVELPRSIKDELYRKAFLLPSRVKFARALSRICRCAIDISDGLVGDLKHILKASGVGARLEAEQLPLDPLLKTPQVTAKLSLVERQRLALTGGCDYELLFTLPKRAEVKLFTLAAAQQVLVSRIGTVLPQEAGLTVYAQGKPSAELNDLTSFEHF